MEVPVAKYLNGGRVAILKMHIPRADYSMGIRTIAAAVPRSQTTSPVLLRCARAHSLACLLACSRSRSLALSRSRRSACP